MANNYAYVVLDPEGIIAFIDPDFTECLKYLIKLDFFKDPDKYLNEGVACFKIAYIQKRPFKIIRDIQINIYDELRRKEVMNRDTKDNTSDNLFEEW